jgi:hypothetical protein
VPGQSENAYPAATPRGIDVDQLQAESRQLYRALDKWWTLPAPPSKPGDQRSDFWRKLDVANALLLEHHQKIKHLGELLLLSEDPIGQKLIEQSQSTIDWLSAPPERRRLHRRSPPFPS